MKVHRSRLPGCAIIEPAVFGDARGFFFEEWNKQRFREAGIAFDVVQANVSRSVRGVLRGLHYQWPNPQGKLVSVLEGEVYDVAVDIRRGSPTYAQWQACVLSAENKKHFWIPEGFAHGFVVLSETADFLYKTTDYWAPEHERCIAWSDPDLAIEWPLGAMTPQVSAKDAAGAAFRDAEVFP